MRPLKLCDLRRTDREQVNSSGQMLVRCKPAAPPVAKQVSDLATDLTRRSSGRIRCDRTIRQLADHNVVISFPSLARLLTDSLRISNRADKVTTLNRREASRVTELSNVLLPTRVNSWPAWSHVVEENLVSFSDSLPAP
jgi:hypothetical protein